MIPPDANAAFVAAMEDVLEVYTRPHDPDFPVVCLDETSKQLIAETRVPIPVKPGHPARHDYEYERNGTANLFMMFAPLEGFAHVRSQTVTPPWTYARGLKELLDSHFPDAKKTCRCSDNSKYRQSPASTRRCLSRAEARRRSKGSSGTIPKTWQLAGYG